MTCRGPAGRFVGQLPFFYGLWSFLPEQAGGEAPRNSSRRRISPGQLVEASVGYDLPSFKSYYDFETWKTVEPPLGTVYNYLRAAMSSPASPDIRRGLDVASQIYNQSIHTIMVAKVCQGNEPIDKVIAWAKGELEDCCEPEARRWSISLGTIRSVAAKRPSEAPCRGATLQLHCGAGAPLQY